MADGASIERYRQAVIAGHRGSLEATLGFLEDPAPLVRQAALGALARIGACEHSHLRAAFGDPAPEVRRRAAELAATTDGVDPAPLLDDPDASVVEIACFACGEIDWSSHPTEPPVASLSTIATGHAEPLCRESAAAALGAIGDPGGLDAVLAACEDRVTVRRRAVLALAAFEDPRVDAALTAALEDKDWQVRQAAEDLLEVARRYDDPYAELED